MTELLRYIENNIAGGLDAEALSGVGYVSRAQLYRDFYSLTGHSVKEYVRKRRLSNALALIRASELPLTEAAYRCGYSSHQALCRAVGGVLGVTPSEYRSGSAYYFFPPFTGEPLYPVTVSGGTVPETLRALFYHPSLKNIENAAVGAFLKAFPGYDGRIFGRNGEQSGSRFSYELYLTDLDLDRGKLRENGFLISGAVPCRSAVFAAVTVRNEEATINAAWDYLYLRWLHGSMFEQDAAQPYFEEYVLKNKKLNKLRLYLPVKKRRGETKITLTGNPALRFVVARAEGKDAEKAASKAAVEYLSAHHPYIVRASKELYVQRGGDFCVCGVRVNAEIKMRNAEIKGAGSNVEMIVTACDHYLVLESGVMGDYGKHAETLLTFARENGMMAEENGIFAVYDASDSFDKLSIKMYCPVKI